MSLCIVANWKLNGSREFNQQWALEFFKHFNGDNFSSLGIAPASVYIDHLQGIFNNRGIKIGAQNIDFLETGARTGEISAPMIKDLGCEFSIIGHSERRILFDETNQIICQKLIQANNCSLIPILCLGESDEENQANNTFNVLEKQIIEALTGITELSSLIIAYEPIWAIGSGKIPNPEEINSVHEMIKDVVQSRFPKIGLKSVLYGGSVNFKNASSLFKQKNIDGALIGGASLDGKEFALIANVFNELKVLK
ncbi:MAG: triose-phosphate isomerase [SAR86 cluster bacterium]|nr:triose-phosphate isomerase [SAR86 cluster bacterium]